MCRTWHSHTLLACSWKQTRSSMPFLLSLMRIWVGTLMTTFACAVIVLKSTRQIQTSINPTSCTVCVTMLKHHPENQMHFTQLLLRYVTHLQLFSICFNFLPAINGYVFESSQTLGFCNGEVATWHVSSIGVQDYIQTATFYGHVFQLNKRKEDFLSLYPMTGETIRMDMDNQGQFQLKMPFCVALNFTWKGLI